MLTILIALLAFFAPVRVQTQPLPAQLSDEAFWKMMTEFSESGGYFRSDNFVSNEMTFQYVIKDLKKTRPGGVYLGVGPDQNFTYIVALQPKMAIIFDIRRQNAMQHLMYKALLETSADRAEFLSKLFSRKRPANLSEKSTSEELFAAYDAAEADREMFQDTLKAVKHQLEETHHFKLSSDDEVNVEYVLRAFYAGGPDLTYNGIGGGGFGRSRMPSYAEIMQSTDEEGRNLSYMGTEENFRVLQGLEKKNLIVPVVGDFAGPKAIRAVAGYLKEHDAYVTAFYLSNVEQYLFQQNDDWSRFYHNVESLPVDSSATFIRSVFNGLSQTYQSSGGLRSVSLLCSIPELLKAFHAGDVRTYSDVINMSK
jgi:hypothetical protein